MDWARHGIIAAIGVALAAHRSSYLIDYAVIVYVFNRGLRRLLITMRAPLTPFLR